LSSDWTGLIPFGLLLAFSTDSDEQETRRSVILSPRNLGLAAAMVAVRCSRGRDHALRFAHADAHGLSHQNVAPLVQCHKQWATT